MQSTKRMKSSRPSWSNWRFARESLCSGIRPRTIWRGDAPPYGPGNRLSGGVVSYRGGLRHIAHKAWRKPIGNNPLLEAIATLEANASVRRRTAFCLCSRSRQHKSIMHRSRSRRQSDGSDRSRRLENRNQHSTQICTRGWLRNACLCRKPVATACAASRLSGTWTIRIIVYFSPSSSMR